MTMPGRVVTLASEVLAIGAYSCDRIGLALQISFVV